LLANLDPKRDLAFVEGPIDQLDHGASQALYGGKVCIDGTRKWAEEGYRREWPEVCRASDETSRRVDERWAALGLGGVGRASRGAHVNGVGGLERVVRAARELLGKERRP
jgi:4-hydroxy-3-polyprenylbenzoate decarboxylase